MDNDYKSYIEKLSREQLLYIITSIDKERYPERYKLIVERLKELEQDMEQEGIDHFPQREYASVLTRFGAIVIDGLLIIPFYLPIFFVSSILEEGGGGDPSAFFSLVFLLSFIGMIVFGIWNTIVRMGKTGQSLGRKFLNIAVLTSAGEPIGVGRAALREIIGRWISGLVCYLGYLNAFWDRDNQMWHDKMANCYVYYVKEDFS